MVRGKFCVIGVTHGVDPTVKNVKLNAVYDDGTPENQRYSRWTPAGTIEMQISNPSASDVFVPGKEFYVDFTPVEKS